MVIRPDFTQHRYALSQRLMRALDARVAYGPFQGMLLPTQSTWSAADAGSMLLGMYECEVLSALDECSRERDTFVDVGAADGYYAVGALVSSMFSRVVCFESDPRSQEVIEQQARRNGVSSQLTILGEAGVGLVPELHRCGVTTLSEVVILFDIEGGEYSLLTKEVLQELREAILIIELHDAMQPQLEAELDLLSRLSDVFEVEYLEQGARDPNSFVELSEWNDDDRWILCSESRMKPMRWAVCRPKNNPSPSEGAA